MRPYGNEAAVAGAASQAFAWRLHHRQHIVTAYGILHDHRRGVSFRRHPGDTLVLVLPGRANEGWTAEIAGLDTAGLDDDELVQEMKMTDCCPLHVCV